MNGIKDCFLIGNPNRTRHLKSSHDAGGIRRAEEAYLDIDQTRVFMLPTTHHWTLISRY